MFGLGFVGLGFFNSYFILNEADLKSGINQSLKICLAPSSPQIPQRCKTFPFSSRESQV